MPKVKNWIGQKDDDWWDEASQSKLVEKRSLQRKLKAKGLGTKAGTGRPNATVVEVFPKKCRAILETTGQEVLCEYRRAKIFQSSSSSSGFRERTPVTVGDRIRVEKTGAEGGVVVALAPRDNALIRKAPGKEGGLAHVIAANVDWVVIVVSVAEPAFSPGLVDRYWVASRSQRLETVLCVSKMDLWQPSMGSPWEIYESLGVSVFKVSNQTHEGIEALTQSLAGKTSVFCGHSGVGKTSLLNSLLPDDLGKTNQVSPVTGKGRHTTTGAILRAGPQNSQWIDTPGVREFALIGVDSDNVGDYFPEFEKLPCTQRGCLHMAETDCQAKNLVRYGSYVRIMESLMPGATR